MHTPVLLKEVVNGLKLKPYGLYIDATVGEGGHLKALMENEVRILAIDWDEEQIAHLKQNLRINKNVILKTGNFSQIEKIAKENDFFPVDGILFDLGLSMSQVNTGNRGFSYKKRSEPLDMRLSIKTDIKASEIVNSYSKEQLYEILAGYSEEINSGAIAANIVRARSLKPILTVEDLTMTIDESLKQKDKSTYARVFQALRIAVNSELENLKKGLMGALNILKPSGIVEVITFHSLEDRVVKLFARQHDLVLSTVKVRKFGRPRFEQSAKLRILTKQ